MKRTDSSYFIDSSIWMSYFYATGAEAKELIESKAALFTSIISLYEIKKKFLQAGHSDKEIKRALGFIKERSTIVDLNEILVEKAAELSVEKRLHAIDAIIYTSALETNATLVTSDSDFKGIEDVKVI